MSARRVASLDARLDSENMLGDGPALVCGDSDIALVGQPLRTSAGTCHAGSKTHQISNQQACSQHTSATRCSLRHRGVQSMRLLASMLARPDAAPVSVW